MKRVQWHLWLIVFVLGLAVLALPGVAAAAPDSSISLARTNNSIVVEGPVPPTFAIPGVFSLTLGDKLSTAEVDLPVLNATATVSGLKLGPSPAWDSITLTQKQPSVTQAATVSGLQATVQGPSTGYSTDLSGRVEVHPNDAIQAEATFAANYDGLARSFGLGIQDGNVAVMAGPVNFAMAGLNTGKGTLAIDKLGVQVPAIGATVILDGYNVGNGKADWNSLSIAGQGMQFGNVAAISDVQVNIPGPSTAYTNPFNASANLALNLGQVVQVEGQLGAAVDPATRQTTITLSDGNAMVGVPAWNLTFSGINAGGGTGLAVDNIAMHAQPLNMTVEMSGVAMGGGSGFTFDQAKITQAGDGSGTGGFEMLVTKTPQGYVLQTTSLIPVAASK
jgi:hypothetical protein